MNQHKFNVLSLFDGISAAHTAINQLRIPINRYYSAEICPYALRYQSQRYGDDNTHFVKLGDVRNVKGNELGQISLVIAGSPCTQLSSINKSDRSGLEGKDSMLLYEAARILKEVQSVNKDVYYLFENVASMANSERDKISKVLGVKPILIDSALVSASHRRRYYWTNIPGIEQPTDLGLTFQSILDNGYTNWDKARVLLSSHPTLTNGIYRAINRKIGNIIYQSKDFANLPDDEKLKLYPELLANSGYDPKKKYGPLEFGNGVYRQLTIMEAAALMGFDGNRLLIPGISKTQALKMLGLSFNIPTIKHILSHLPIANE